MMRLGATSRLEVPRGLGKSLRWLVGTPAGRTEGRVLWPNQERVHRECSEDPDKFWYEAAMKYVTWDKPPPAPNHAGSTSWTDGKMYPWFEGATLNTCYNMVDRHVDLFGRGDAPALIHECNSFGLDKTRRISYGELQEEVSALATVLHTKLGVGKGDTVVLYFPAIPEAIFAMLACARVGAVHSVVFGGFAPPELAKRIDDAKPKAVLTASYGVERDCLLPYVPMVEEAVRLSSWKPNACVVVDRDDQAAEGIPRLDPDLKRREIGIPQLDWKQMLQPAYDLPLSKRTGCVPVDATDPLYILYTSGTTGSPKGIVRDNGGHAVSLLWSMENVYNVDRDETFFAASDIGWVVGHSYMCYAPLLNGSSTVMLEGKPVLGANRADELWRVCAKNRVKCMFTAPTAMRAIKKEDPEGVQRRRHDLSSMQTLFLAGERCDPDTMLWARDILNPTMVVDNWWQTELGWPALTTCIGLEENNQPIGDATPGSVGAVVPGYDVRLFNDLGEEGDEGDLFLKLPLPPGTLRGVWNNEVRLRKSYLVQHPGWFNTGDMARRDERGCIHVMGRTDDIINVAGHRLSSGVIEEHIGHHRAVAECAVVAVQHQIKGQIPVAIVVLKAGHSSDEADRVKNEIVSLVRTGVGAFACLDTVHAVRALPKTRSGKVLRRSLRELANGAKCHVPPTIEDVRTLHDIAALFDGTVVES